MSSAALIPGSGISLHAWREIGARDSPIQPLVFAHAAPIRELARLLVVPWLVPRFAGRSSGFRPRPFTLPSARRARLGRRGAALLLRGLRLSRSFGRRLFFRLKTSMVRRGAIHGGDR
jgi:hypothetical protein